MTQKPNKSRIFTITLLNEKNDLDEINNKINELVNLNIIQDYAYCCHDKDFYTLEEEAEGKGKANTLKKAHTHYLIRFSINCTKTIDQVAKLFDKPSNLIEFANNFKRCLRYLTHMDSKGKFQYEPSEVICNFDYIEKVSQSTEKSISDVIYQIINNGLTLKQALKILGPYLYTQAEPKLVRARTTYLTKTAQLPPYRLNIYITGSRGAGKDILSKALARYEYAESISDEEIFFEVGEKGVEFQNYDGQPVIIWSDIRAESILEKYTAEGFLKMIDVIPQDIDIHKKYGSTKLINSINIFNGIDDYETFINKLSSKNHLGFFKEAPGQFTRRIPCFIVINHDYLEVFINTGFSKDGDYENYKLTKVINGSIQRLASDLNDIKAIQSCINQFLSPLIIEEINSIDFRKQKRLTIPQALSNQPDFGKTIAF